MNNELEIYQGMTPADIAKKFDPNNQGGEGGFTFRTMKFKKKSRQAFYNIGFKGDMVEMKLPLTGVIIGLYKKFELSSFKDKEVVYNYQTTEFPFYDSQEMITIIDKKEKTELAKIQARDLDAWCIAKNKETGSPKWIAEFDDKIVKGFKSKQVLYVMDLEDNIYRMELSGDYNLVDDFMKSLGEEHLCTATQAIINIGLSKEPMTKGDNTFHTTTIDFVGKVEQEDMLKFSKAQLDTYIAIKRIHAIKNIEVNDNVEPEGFDIADVSNIFEEKEPVSIIRDADIVDNGLDVDPFVGTDFATEERRTDDPFCGAFRSDVSHISN